MGSNQLGENNLHKLVRSSIVTNRLKFLQTLEKNGFKLNAFDRDGYSSLMIAVKYESLDVIPYLIQIGADVDYKAPDGKTAQDFTTKREILDLLIRKPIESDFALDEFELIEWEPEPEVRILKQDPDEIGKSQVFFDYITATDPLDNREEWDSEGFELPNFLEIPQKILLPLTSAKLLAEVLYSQRIFPKDYDALELLGTTVNSLNVDVGSIQNYSVDYDDFDIALSCAGVMIENESYFDKDSFDDHILPSFEEKISDLLDIIIEERKNRLSLYEIHRLQQEIKNRKTLSTEDLFGVIKQREHELTDTVIGSKNALILLFSQYANIEVIIEDRDEEDSLLEEIEFDENREELDESSEVENDDDQTNKQLKYSVSKTMFGSSSLSKVVVNSLIKELISQDTISDQLTEQCLTIIRKILPTTAAYEIVLNKLVESGIQEILVDRIDSLLAEIQALRYEIALQNYGLIPYVVKQIYTRDVEAVDLCQEGFLGLMQAIEKFDGSYGGTLSTYAVHWIRQRMTRYRDETFSTIRLPIHFLSEYNKITYLLEELEDTNLASLSYGEIAEQLNVPELKVYNYFTYHREIVSADQLIDNSPIFGLVDSESYGEEESFPDPNEDDFYEAFYEYYEYEDSIDASNLVTILGQFLQQFPDRDRDIVIKRYGLAGDKPMTLEELGKEYDLTRERIRQIEARTFKKLKSKTRFREVLEQFL